MAVSNNNDFEKRLWSAADELRANSRMRAADYSIPVLGLIFLRYADFKFSQAEKAAAPQNKAQSTRRRGISKIDYQARGVMYLPNEARWSNLDEPARRREYRQSHQRCHARHRSGERRPQGRAPQDL